MRVFIDSNQFISDFMLESGVFSYLRHFMNNMEHTLLLSRLVVEEAENKYIAETSKAVADNVKSQNRLVQLGLLRKEDIAPALPPTSLGLEARVRELMEKVVVVEYSDVPHADVVNRALARKKPFDADGAAGYRDCLMWLSLLRHLEEQGDDEEEVVFISSNWRDFYQSAPSKAQDTPDLAEGGRRAFAKVESKSQPVSSVRFHQDLLADLSTAKWKLFPFNTIKEFVDARVDKSQHVVNLDQKYDHFEEFLEQQGLIVLGHLDRANGKTVLKALFSGAVASELTIVSSAAETFEGVEDLDIAVAEPVGKEIFVSCEFNLRMVSVDIFIPKTQFENHKAKILDVRSVWDISHLDELVALRVTLRAYFQASFIFDPKTKECSGFSLETFDVR